MTATAASPVGILSALVMTCAALAFNPQPVAAQTATNLKCKGCVGARDLKKNAVKTNRIRNNAVTGAKITDGAVTGAKVADGSVTAADLGDEAGVDFLNTATFVDIDVTTTYSVMRSLSVSAPGPGFVTCIAAGQADWDIGTKTLALQIGWDTVGGPTDPVSSNFVRDNNTDVTTIDLRIPITAMHTFTVAGAGTTTFNLKARCLGCAPNDMDYSFHSAACMYYPTQY